VFDRIVFDRVETTSTILPESERYGKLAGEIRGLRGLNDHVDLRIGWHRIADSNDFSRPSSGHRLIDAILLPSLDGGIISGVVKDEAWRSSQESF